jgi:hypothetical protein
VTNPITQKHFHSAVVVKIAKPTVEISDKVRLNLEKFVWSSRRKIAKEKSENSDAMRTLKDAVERR